MSISVTDLLLPCLAWWTTRRLTCSHLGFCEHRKLRYTKSGQWSKERSIVDTDWHWFSMGFRETFFSVLLGDAGGLPGTFCMQSRCYRPPTPSLWNPQGGTDMLFVFWRHPCETQQQLHLTPNAQRCLEWFAEKRFCLPPSLLFSPQKKASMYRHDTLIWKENNIKISAALPKWFIYFTFFKILTKQKHKDFVQKRGKEP